MTTTDDRLDTVALQRLSLNTATTKYWTLQQAIDGAVRAGIPALGVWRDRVAEVGTDRAARMIQDAGLRVSSLCRGGFLTAADPAEPQTALADNRAAIAEAAALGTDSLIMVVGGLPDGERDIVGARHRVADRIADLVPHAIEHGVRLVLEPLHPMYCADRAVLSTLGQALDLAAPHPAEAVGVVVDTFHVWWDPTLAEQIARAGRFEDLVLPAAEPTR
jgi:sugar phosphate isomerase/epimerase